MLKMLHLIRFTYIQNRLKNYSSVCMGRTFNSQNAINFDAFCFLKNVGITDLI